MAYTLLTIVGLLAIISSATRLFPQIIKGYKVKSVRDVSMTWELVGAVSAFLWTWYGVLASDTIVMWSGIVIGVGYFTLMYQHKIYE